MLKRLVVAFIFAILIIPCLGYQSCTTKFIILDCDNNPVSSATITIVRCSDNKKFVTVTDLKGEGSFPVCKDEICKTMVSYLGYENKVVPKVGNNCDGNKCKIKICSD